MARIDKPASRSLSGDGLCDPDGFPWLENGERMDQKTFHERYLKTPASFRAELIGGIVYLRSSPSKIRHGRSSAEFTGWLYLYQVATPGTIGQNNATTILGAESECQPDSALLILPSHGGQTVDGDDKFTHGAPELVVEVAWSSRSLDLNAKLRDYERAGVREYIVRDLRGKAVQWFALTNSQLEPSSPSPDGLFRSRVFPGLWLDPSALLNGNHAMVVAALQRGLASPEHAEFVADLERRREERAARA